MAAAAAVALAIAAVVGFDSVRSAERERARAAAIARTGPATIDVARAIDAAVADEAPSPQSLATLVLEDGELLVRDPGAGLRPGDEISAALRLAVLGARDRGMPIVHVRTGDPAVFVVEPSFDGPASTTAQRREGFAAATIRSIDVPALLDAAFADTPDRVEISSAGTVLASIGPEPGGDVISRFETTVLGTRLDLVARAATPATGLLAWAWLAIGWSSAIAAVLLGHRRSVRARAAARRRRIESRKRRLVAEVATLLRASPEAAETLPAVFVRLADELNLAAAAIHATDIDGADADIFSFGAASVARSDAHRITVPLIHTGRQIGSLNVYPREPLLDEEAALLETIGDMIAAALATSEIIDAERAIVERLNHLDRLKTDFLATVSHEVRTPLASILGFATLLRERWEHYSREEVGDFVTRIERNAAALSTMLGEILDFSRLERGALRVDPEPLDAAGLVRDLLARNAPMLDAHEVTLDAPEHAYALADRGALDRIMSNLLSNATKFSPDASRIRVGVARDDGSIVLGVEDEGPGVPEAERQEIFNRFYRGSSELARRTRGSGIGLSVVRDLVASLHGSVHVEAGAHGGARFVVRLPATDSQLDAASLAAPLGG